MTAGDVGLVVSYLQANINAGATVAFVAVGNSYVFQDGGAVDSLVQLTGLSASQLNTDGLGVGRSMVGVAVSGKSWF